MALIIILMIVAYASGVTHYFTFETLKERHIAIQDFVSRHAVLTPVLFILIYIISSALSLPIGIFLSLLGGYLFSQPWSTLCVVVGATIGATCIFLAAKTALGDFLRKKAGPFLKKMEKGFQKNATSYLLFLRLVPIFPFWLVNLAPAFFGIKLRTFIWTTFVGIIPGAFVFTQAGDAISAILNTQGEISIDAIFNIQVKIALIALGIFALIPILIKKIRERKH